MSIRSLPFALAVSLLATASSPAAERAPAPRLVPTSRPVFPRFDLTYLPTVGVQGVAAFRPAAIAKHARGLELGHYTHMLLQMVLEQLAEGDLSAAEPPAFADLDECVFNLSLFTTCPTPGKKGTAVAGFRSPCTFRTVKPFDWDARVRKWFPRATVAHHGGRAYFRVPCRILPDNAEPLGLFAPDNRTLVCGSESEITELIDRLNDGGPPPAGPPGWSEVDHDLVALGFDSRLMTPVQGEWPKDRRGLPEAATLVRAVQTAALGLTVEDRTRVRVVITAKDETQARAATHALRFLFEMAAESVVSEKEAGAIEVMATELVKNVTIDCRGRQIAIQTSAAGNLVRTALTALHGPD